MEQKNLKKNLRKTQLKNTLFSRGFPVFVGAIVENQVQGEAFPKITIEPNDYSLFVFSRRR